MNGILLALAIPAIGGLLLAIGGKLLHGSAKIIAFTTMLFGFGVVAGLVAKMDSAKQGFQFMVDQPWIYVTGSRFSFGLDGISSWMVMLTAFLGLVAVVIAKPAERQASFFANILGLTATLIGVFTALDLVLFYVFFELSLVPVALLILGWGRGEKQKAAIRYLAMLFGASLLMLVGIVILAVQHQRVTGTISTSIVDLQALAASGELWKGAPALESIAFWGFLLAFLVKSPAVPGHTWLSSTYQSAPISASVAGVVLKVGTYGLFRFCLPLFPNAAQSSAPVVIALGVLGIIYGGILAINQKDVFRMMAFSTVSHVGFILIGLFSFTHTGMMGAAFQQFNHGLASAAIFVLLGFLIDRGFTGSFSETGGLKKTMPVMATLFLIAMLANLGLPLTSGFVGEILALMGLFEAGHAGAMGLNFGYVAVAGIGAILSAAYMLYAYQRLFYGEPSDKAKSQSDVNFSEYLVGAALVAALLVGGVLPTTILNRMEASVALTGNTLDQKEPATWQKAAEVELPAKRIYVAVAKGEAK